MIRPLAVALFVVTLCAAPASGAGAGRCPSFDFEHGGVPWSAEEIRIAGGAGCKGARRVIRSYAQPRNCRFVAPCRLEGFVCETKRARGSAFVERCTAGKRVVRWRGSYISA